LGIRIRIREPRGTALGIPILLQFKLLAVATSILVDFWIFSDQAQLLDPESAASKEPRSGLVA
jgi:hypothetical protein